MNGTNSGAGKHGYDGLRYHRHINNHAVSFDHAQIFQDGAKNLDLLEQVRKCQCFLRVHNSAVVNQRRLLGPANFHMPVDAIEARVALGPHEPVAILAGVSIEHFFGRLHPIDLRGRFGPKSLRIFLPAVINLMIAARHFFLPETY